MTLGASIAANKKGDHMTDQDEKIDLRAPHLKPALERYWLANVRVVAILIPLWAAVSLGCGVLFADVLNRYTLPGTGYPLGFWFAQQGSIIVFVLITLIYCVSMNRLDARHRRDLKRRQADAGEDRS
jgi:putative solute:sodium symporter small subunit